MLARDFALHPVIAAEIEFYVAAEPDWQALKARVPFEAHAQEEGEGQWEVTFAMQRDASVLARQIEDFKTISSADFSAKPFESQPGSGLHIHLHLEDAAGKNVFFKKDEIISEPLKHSIGGLLATMREYMPVFAPSATSLARFAPGGNAPTTVSWGANNRTCAIRLPDAGAPHRHIEHRVAGADADPEAVIAAVLAGMHYGLQNKCDPGPQIYGDASLEMYKLPRLVA